MIDSDKASPSKHNILPQDIQLIDYFILGKRKLISGSNLHIEYGAKAVKLIDQQNRVVGVSKQVNEWQQKILLYRNSIYLATIQEKINQSNFLAVSRNGHPDFAEYHRYQIPRGYQLFYEPAYLILKSWQERHERPAGYQPNSIMIYQGNNWYPVQEIDTYKEIILLRTIISEITIGNRDLIIWIDRLPINQQSTANPTTSAFHQPATDQAQLPRPTANSGISTPPSIKETNPTTTFSTFDPDKVTEDATNELTAVFKTPVIMATPPASEEVLTNLKNSIKLKALARLVDYLNDGEKIVNTEVVKNNQGQVVSTKVTEINRGCPRWVIEQIKKF
jgi:hypothetical protein